MPFMWILSTLPVGRCVYVDDFSKFFYKIIISRFLREKAAGNCKSNSSIFCFSMIHISSPFPVVCQVNLEYFEIGTQKSSY